MANEQIPARELGRSPITAERGENDRRSEYTSGSSHEEERRHGRDC